MPPSGHDHPYIHRRGDDNDRLFAPPSSFPFPEAESDESWVTNFGRTENHTRRNGKRKVGGKQKKAFRPG